MLTRHNTIRSSLLSNLLDLSPNTGMLNNTSGWVRVHPQDPVTVACTSPCGQVEWTVIPNTAIQNITVLSRTDQRCNSLSGVCVNDYSEPCPGDENEYMQFKLSLKTTTTIIIQCNAYVIFSSDLTTRHMMRGDSFLVIVEEEEDIQGMPVRLYKVNITRCACIEGPIWV